MEELSSLGFIAVREQFPALQQSWEPVQGLRLHYSAGTEGWGASEAMKEGGRWSCPSAKFLLFHELAQAEGKEGQKAQITPWWKPKWSKCAFCEAAFLVGAQSPHSCWRHYLLQTPERHDRYCRTHNKQEWALLLIQFHQRLDSAQNLI